MFQKSDSAVLPATFNGSPVAPVPHNALNAQLRLLRTARSQIELARNTILFNEGDAAKHVYEIISGTIRLCRYMPDGRRYIADFAMAGDVLCLDEGAISSTTAEAVTDVILHIYDRRHVEQLGARDARNFALIFSHICASLVKTRDHQFILGSRNAKERLAAFLVNTSVRADLASGDILTLTMNRQDIADHLGMTIETVCRALGALRQAGLIKVIGAYQFILCDLNRLHAMAYGQVDA